MIRHVKPDEDSDDFAQTHTTITSSVACAIFNQLLLLLWNEDVTKIIGFTK